MPDTLKGKNTLTVNAPSNTYSVVEDVGRRSRATRRRTTTLYRRRGSLTLAAARRARSQKTTQAGTLIVKKLVVNDNGGTKIATDFSFKVNGGTATCVYSGRC